MLKDFENELNESKNELNKVKKSSKKDLEQQLLDAIQKSPELTQKQLAVELSVSVSITKRILEKLQRNGLVIRKGSKRKGEWFINREEL